MANTHIMKGQTMIINLSLRILMLCLVCLYQFVLHIHWHGCIIVKLNVVFGAALGDGAQAG